MAAAGSVTARSQFVTAAALIARNQAVAMPAQFGRALDNGVTPAEMSEIITHLAFYAGWPNAQSAVAAASDLFAERGIDTADLPSVDDPLLPFDVAAEDQRRTGASRTTVRSRRAWLSTPPTYCSPTCGCAPALAPRDRSLITVSALVAAGQTDRSRTTSAERWTAD